MLQNSILLFITFGISLVLSKHNLFYRKDYTYIEEYDAYYKLHWDSSGWSWNSAFMACDNEGAKLFYPTGDEWTLVKNLADAMLTPPNTTEIFVGLHNQFGLGEFITVDGEPTEKPLNIANVDANPSEDQNVCVVMDYSTGQFRVTECFISPDDITAFVCKKINTESCPTIDHDYKYVKAARKCFKVNNTPMTWQAAMQTCYTEGGILAVIEDFKFSTQLDLQLTQSQSYFIGFKKIFSHQLFYTVKGKRYNNPDFISWYTSQNYLNEACGTLIAQNSYNGGNRIEADSCLSQLPFICEMTAYN